MFSLDMSSTTFGAIGSVSCNPGYKPSMNSVACRVSGVWEEAECVKEATDCYDLLVNDGVVDDGVYTVTTWKSHRKVQVYCDMSTDGGGWTVFQNRFDGSVDFNRNFYEYENGFGETATEFWLGLSYIKEIADQGDNRLRIDLQDALGVKGYEAFAGFSLSGNPDYTLSVGPSVDSLEISSGLRFTDYHNSMTFSTFDHITSVNGETCIPYFPSGWWWADCFSANLNGLYLTPGTEESTGLLYLSFRYSPSLKSSKMMMRRNSEN